MYSQDTYREYGTTVEEFIKRYPSLIGNDDYATGEVAGALRTASEKLGPQGAELLERKFAKLFAYMLIACPHLKQKIPHPGVTIDTQNRRLKLGEITAVDLDASPKIVMEYGPGIPGVHKIPNEVSQIPTNIYIESGVYASQVLFTLASHYDLAEPSFIGRENGIKEAGKDALESGLENSVDIITAAMVQSAGPEEFTAGIKQGKKLLRPNGLFVIQAPTEVKPGEMSGNAIFEVTRDTFGDPMKICPYRIGGGSRTAYYTVFKK